MTLLQYLTSGLEMFPMIKKSQQKKFLYT